MNELLGDLVETIYDETAKTHTAIFESTDPDIFDIKIQFATKERMDQFVRDRK